MTETNNQMYLTKEFTFDSAHKLDWYEGKCKDLHGHTYKLQITIEGTPNENGIIIDFSEVKNIVKKEIISKLDHKLLNDIISNPTAENISTWIWNKLEKKLNLHEIKLWETPTSHITILKK